MSAVYCGILFASLVSFAVMSSMAEAEYLAWGWRIPFLAALPMGLAVVFLRRYLPETEVSSAPGPLYRSAFSPASRLSLFPGRFLPLTSSALSLTAP